MSAVNTSAFNSQKIDARDSSSVPINAQGSAFLAPIVNTGSNPIYGVINNYHASVPVNEVKDRFYGVPAENRAFVDRPSILASMEAALSSPSNGCRILVLKGLGGMGKTQLMLQYCYLHRTAYDYVFWLEVDSWNAAIESFRSLAINLGLDEEIAKGKDSENKLIDWVRSWLQSKTKWLLLLNNADNIMSNDVFKLLPRIGGDIILTMREPTPSRMAMVISVDKMQQMEALFLLFGVSSMDMIEQDSRKLHYAREIIIELDFLPLAIDLARAYINSTHISFQKYLNMFKDSKKRISLFRYRDEDNSNHYKHNVATVWQLSFEKIRALNPATVPILEACAFLQPEAIPVCLFRRQYSVLELISPSSVDPASEQDNEQSWEFIEKAVAVLEKFSFVTRTCLEAEDGVENPVNDLLTIHRLVQKVIYETMDDRQRLHWADNLSTALNKDTYFSESDIYAPRTRIIMDPYLSHIRHFITILDNLGQKPFISKDLSSLLDRAIWYLLRHWRYFGISKLVQFSRIVSEATYGEEDWHTVSSLINHAEFHRQLGKYVEAEPLYKRALAIEEKAKGSEHPHTAASLIHLANVYSDQGKYDKAELLYKRALIIFEKVKGSEHPDTAQSLNNLAILYFNRGKYDEAEPLYKRALVIREKALGSEHPNTATSLNNLANVYSAQGKYNEAEPLYKRALKIREKALGSDHPAAATSLNNLANVYSARGKYDEAEPLCKRALMIRMKVLGSEHPDTATSLNNLANVYSAQDKYGEAEPLYKRALEIREKTLGSEHPDTAQSLNSLAILYDNQGKYDEAEPLYERALVIREKAFGSEHPDTAKLLNNLAILFKNRGKYDEAEQLYQRGLMIYEKALGSEHPDTAHSLNNLAILYDNRGKYDEAEPLYKRASVILEKALGSEHPETARSLNNLASMYFDQGKYNEAEPLYKRALVICEKAFGSEHPDTATSLHNLALLYDNWGEYDEAEPLCKRALVIREEALGSEHPDTAQSLNSLAILYDNQGKYDEAELLYERALLIREKALGLEHPDTTDSLNNLATLYDDQGKYNEAEPLYKRALVICEKALGSEHPDTADSLYNLALLYFNRGNYDEAEPLCIRALAIYEEIFGSEHIKTVNVRNKLTSVQSQMGQVGLFKKRPALWRSFKLRWKRLSGQESS